MTTHSELACFRDCPRKRLLRYGYGLRQEIEPGYLTFGRAWALLHEAESIDKLALDPFQRAALDVLFASYPFAFEYLAIEREFPATEAERRALPLDYAGKIDAIVRLKDGRLAVMERKTTAALDDNYWKKLEFDSQVTGYFIAARACGYDVQTVVYDVVEKPSIKPLKATANPKYKADGTLYANQRAFDETPAEYAARVFEWVAADHRFHLKELPITSQRIKEWEDDYHTQKAVIRAGAAWRNPNACVIWNPCEFLNVCHRSDLDTNTPDGFRRSGEKHPELQTATAAVTTASQGQA